MSDEFGGAMWIKHYSNARQSEYVTHVMSKYGWEGYGKYWGLLEFLASNYTGGEPTFHVQRETIRGLFGVRSWTDLQSFVDHLTNERVLKFALSGNVYRIDAPILLDLLNRDFKRARSERAESAPREDKIREDKIRVDKNKSISGAQTLFAHPTSYDEFLSIFPLEVQNHWLDLYGNDKDWILRELKECYGYFYIKKTKKPSASFKGWASRASAWLGRGWESYTKSTRAQNSPSINSLVKSPENFAWANQFANQPPALKEVK